MICIGVKTERQYLSMTEKLLTLTSYLILNKLMKMRICKTTRIIKPLLKALYHNKRLDEKELFILRLGVHL